MRAFAGEPDMRQMLCLHDWNKWNVVDASQEE